MRKIFFIALLLCIKQINAQVCFTQYSNYNISGPAESVITSDFNKDGKADLAIAGGGNVSIMMGAGTGSFTLNANYPAGNNPWFVCTADFNGDGNPDLAASNMSSNNVSVLLGSGTGSFAPAANFVTGASPYAVCSGDFNGDGKADLATANSASNNVSVLLGNGLGSFSLAVNYVVGNNPYGICTGDFNADGKTDLATANNNGNNVSVLLGVGDGTFGAFINYGGALTAPRSIISGDFNADGKIDLYVSNFNSATVSLLNGSGTGSFSNGINFPVGSSPRCIISADFDENGVPDIATANYGSMSPYTASVLMNQGGGGPNINLSGATSPHSIASGDFNGDGKPDLVTANEGSNNITVLLNTLPVIKISGSSLICSSGSTTLTASGATTYTWNPSVTVLNTSADTITVSATPSVTTTYTLTGNQSGCGTTDTKTISITVNLSPTPDICLLTADSLALNNIIYWDKTLYPGADSFIVYRYDVGFTTYLRLGALPKDSGMYIDTQRNIGGPNGGDPAYGSWRYKIALLDTCGNMSAQSPYHQSVFVQENSQNFSWNAYAIEGVSNPVTGYAFSRDDNNTGAWHVLINTAVTSATDPNYTSYPNGNWRVDALGFNCTTTARQSNGNQGTVVKSKSNITNNRTTGNSALPRGLKNILVYPNPAGNNIQVKAEAVPESIELISLTGETISKIKPLATVSQIDLSNLAAGVYFIKVQMVQGMQYVKIIKQ